LILEAIQFSQYVEEGHDFRSAFTECLVRF